MESIYSAGLVACKCKKNCFYVCINGTFITFSFLQRFYFIKKTNVGKMP